MYLSFIEHVMALRSLQREHKKHLKREKALGDILDNLRTGYNPNYQDMAVLEAVRGWEQLAGLPHINDVGKDSTEDSEEELGSDEAAVEEEEELEDGMWSAMQLEHMLDDLLATDYEGLLIEHDKFVGTPASPTSICESSPQYDTPDFASNARPQCTTYLPTCPTLSFLTSKPSATSSSPGSNCSASPNPPLMVALVRYASRSFLAPSLTRCPDTSKMQKALNDAQHHLDQIHREKKHR